MQAINQHLFTFEDNQISYRKVGAGSMVLLAFHGFGQCSAVYEPLKDWQKSVFTIYALDLFFHGNSMHQGDQLLTKIAWHRLLSAFLNEHCINRFSLIGFSLGGRFALITVETFADRLDQLFLLAPDGITKSFWYTAATHSRVGRWLFRYTLHHLSLLSGLGHALTQLGVLNRSAMRFVELSLRTAQQRELVYQSWTKFRLSQPDLKLIAQLLSDHSVHVHFVTGAFDRIVPGSYILPLAKQLKQYTLANLRSGHNHLIKTMAQHI